MKQEEVNKIQEKAESFARDFEKILKGVLTESKTPKQAFGFDNGYLENLYTQGYSLYNTGKYQDALHVFRALLMLSPMEPKYMLGVAACQHMLKEYVSAIQGYVLCSVYDPSNPLPHFHSSDCYIQMKNYVSAMICLELAIERAKNDPQFAVMKERALLSLERLKEQMKVATHEKEWKK